MGTTMFTRPRMLKMCLSGSLGAVLLLPGLAPGAAASPPVLPFRDPSLQLSVRVDDLMGRLTLDEKIGFLHQYQPAIPRLGIAGFKAGTELSLIHI